MRKRKVDKTKKSNIKCEHCEAWDFDDKKTEDGVAFYRQKRITGTVARILFGGMIFERLE